MAAARLYASWRQHRAFTVANALISGQKRHRLLMGEFWRVRALLHLQFSGNICRRMRFGCSSRTLSRR